MRHPNTIIKKGGISIYTQILIVEVAKLCNIHMKDPNKSEVRCRCPFCDKGYCKLTATINKEKGVFYCHKCKEGLNAVTLYAKIQGITATAAYKELLDIVA